MEPNYDELLKIVNDNIDVFKSTSFDKLDREQKQVMYDALYNYMLYCNEVAHSNHPAAKEFARREIVATYLTIATREKWGGEINT